MEILTVTHPTGSYPIYLGEGTLASTGQYLAESGWGGRCALITNKTVGQYHAEGVLESLSAAGFDPVRIDLPDGEQFKTLATVTDLYPKLVDSKIDRRSPIIALGGGVLGDMAGFAAASFLRGVPLVQIPTTLLAMVDSSVGGKTGVDLPQGKNLVGAFKQPEMVIIDPQVLATLPAAEFRAGMAEVIKHGIIDAPDVFAALENGSQAYKVEHSTASTSYFLLPTPLLADAISVKVRVVQQDPFEQGRRAVLNLGHTFGHALERLANYTMRHGEAIAIGIVCAARLAARLGYCSAETETRIAAALDRWDLPTQLPAHPAEEIWAAMFTDKKRQGNTLRFILPRDIGDVDIFSDVAKEDVMAILR